jgi:hypothetical protein
VTIHKILDFEKAVVVDLLGIVAVVDWFVEDDIRGDDILVKRLWSSPLPVERHKCRDGSTAVDSWWLLCIYSMCCAVSVFIQTGQLLYEVKVQNVASQLASDRSRKVPFAHGEA